MRFLKTKLVFNKNPVENTGHFITIIEMVDLSCQHNNHRAVVAYATVQ